jgi:hypothetical protein
MAKITLYHLYSDLVIMMRSRRALMHVLLILFDINAHEPFAGGDITAILWKSHSLTLSR